MHQFTLKQGLLYTVLIGGLAKGKYLMPGTELAGERSAEEIRKIAATLD